MKKNLFKVTSIVLWIVFSGPQLNLRRSNAKPIIFFWGYDHGNCSEADELVKLLMQNRVFYGEEKEKLQRLLHHMKTHETETRKEVTEVRKFIKAYSVNAISTETPYCQQEPMDAYKTGHKLMMIISTLRMNGCSAEEAQIQARRIMCSSKGGIVGYILSIENISVVFCIEDHTEKHKCIDLLEAYEKRYNSFESRRYKPKSVLKKFHRDFHRDKGSIEIKIPSEEEINKRLEILYEGYERRSVRKVMYLLRDFLISCNKREELLAPKLVEKAEEGHRILQFMGIKHTLGMKRQIQKAGGYCIYKTSK